MCKQGRWGEHRRNWQKCTLKQATLEASLCSFSWALHSVCCFTTQPPAAGLVIRTSIEVFRTRSAVTPLLLPLPTKLVSKVWGVMPLHSEKCSFDVVQGCAVTNGLARSQNAQHPLAQGFHYQWAAGVRPRALQACQSKLAHLRATCASRRLGGKRLDLHRLT